MPVESGIVIVLSAVGSVIDNVVSNASAVLPSKTILPVNVPKSVISDKLPVVITLPLLSGKLIRLSCVGSVALTRVSKSSSVAPSR